MNKEKENKNAEISARIAEIIEYIGETRNGFATKLGYDRGQTIYDIINMKSAPSYDFFRRFSISEISDIINTDWLLSGKGSMIKQNVILEKSIRSQSIAVDKDIKNSTINQENETSFVYKMYIEEKNENKQLQHELRTLTAEIATLKTKISMFKPNAKKKISQLEAGDHAEKDIAEGVSSKKHSSPHVDDVESVTVL